MNILITGGCGFLGTNLVHFLAENRAEYHLTVFDLLTYAGTKSNIRRLISDKRVAFIQGDICEPGQVSDALDSGIDMVINLAAETHVDRSIMYPSDFIRTNVYGVQVLADQCRMRSISLLHISTDEVYGSTAADESFTEETLLRPSSPYSASKAAADLLLMAANRTHGLDVMILRPVNNLGPYQYPEKIIPLFIDRLSRGLPVPVYGDGMQTRTWLHTDDFCHAMDFAIDGFVTGEIFNLSSKNEIRNIDLVKNLVSMMGKGDDLIRFVDDRPGHDQRYSTDGSKFINQFGWLPRYDFEKALVKTVEWYRANPDWLKKHRTKEYEEYCRKQYGSL